MVNRREFMCSAGGAAAELFAAPLFGAEEKKKSDATPETKVDINGSLRSIVDVLREKKLAIVQPHVVDNPKIGLVQWNWPHFRYDMDSRVAYPSQYGNHQLFECMKEVHRLPAGHFDALMHEGLVEGKIAAQMDEWKATHRELIQGILTKSMNGLPSEEDIVRASILESHQFQTIQQTVSFRGKDRVFNVSPMARLGAGYMMSAVHGTKLTVAEDPILDAEAEKAELSPHDTENYERRIFTDRDAHFIKLVRESRRQIVHFLVGYSHYLLDDIAKANAEGAGISHLLITTPSTWNMKYPKKKV